MGLVRTRCSPKRPDLRRMAGGLQGKGVKGQAVSRWSGAATEDLGRNG